MTSSTLSPLALAGFANASLYDSHRPSYPPEAVTNLLQHLQIDNLPHARVLDLGAGTGKFTELLARREEEYEILAVEPHEGMRRELERKGLRGVKVLEGEAVGIGGVEGQSVDAVVVAQVRGFLYLFLFSLEKGTGYVRRRVGYMRGLKFLMVIGVIV